ncbi:uncharacterized protein LOC132760024 [Ruditapes philippinarum]|uniref:uncharacterized protein LOC132760024 n=1 Tax=Ruditapes philippinarum TaxID=129788 RepID=UPI00295AF497|nr:uncharacterized protein LOC132760024 [Ruditapes philippinarum]
MSDHNSTNVLIVLLVILGVVVILFLITVVAIILRWRKDKDNSNVTFRYLNGSKIEPTTWAHYGQADDLTSPYSEVFPDTFSFSATDESKENTQEQAEDGVKSSGETHRISTISGRSIDLGNVSGVSEFTLNPAVVRTRGTMTYGEYRKMKADSMRSSVGVDLGGDYHKAQRIMGDDDAAFYF